MNWVTWMLLTAVTLAAVNLALVVIWILRDDDDDDSALALLITRSRATKGHDDCENHDSAPRTR
jgi:hypothetical protein